jgi:hypothetical protein
VRLALAALLLTIAAPVQAQQGGMPDLRTINGRPMPVADQAAGTVRIRVSKQIPVNTVAGVEVTAIVAAANGENRKRTAKTDGDGYALFEGLASGSTFQAEATVDGERLQTAKFPIPAQGGIRILLIAALPKGAPAEAPSAGEERFALGAVAGAVASEETLPAGTLEIRLLGADGRPLPNVPLQLGQAKDGSGVSILHATSDAQGVARFRDLPTGEGIGYAAVMAHDGMRLGTEAFRMPADKGMRGELRGLTRTTDQSVLRIDARSKIIFEVGEDSVQMMEQLLLINTSDKVFEPGEGLTIPLAKGFEGGRELEGGTPVEVKAGDGIVLKTPVVPNRGTFTSDIRVVFLVPAGGSSSVDIRQPLPFGMRSPLLIIPASNHLAVEAPGVRKLQDQKDSQGNVVNLFELPEIQPGGELSLTVTGLPALDRRNRKVAGVLCLLLIAAAVVGARRPAEVARAAATAQKLTERREKLFADLVAVERERKETGQSNGALETRRQDLVSKLEGVYRELARVEHGESPPP